MVGVIQHAWRSESRPVHLLGLWISQKYFLGHTDQFVTVGKLGYIKAITLRYTRYCEWLLLGKYTHKVPMFSLSWGRIWCLEVRKFLASTHIIAWYVHY
jgi:hypothetical protein